MKWPKPHPIKAIQLINILLIILWVYTASSKLIDVSLFKHQLDQQHFPVFVNRVLLWFLPIIELAVATLLVFPLTNKNGLVGSFTLLVFFSGYVGLVLLGFFDQVPCACGGVLQFLNWPSHLAFNLFFLLLNGYGLHLFTLRKEVGTI